MGPVYQVSLSIGPLYIGSLFKGLKYSRALYIGALYIGAPICRGSIFRALRNIVAMGHIYI